MLLLGASGAGKSTLLAAVAGLLDGTEHGTGEQEGELSVDGAPAREARARALEAGTGHARTGLLLQDPQAQTVLSRCGDDVAFGLENHRVPRQAIWPRVDAALVDVGLVDVGLADVGLADVGAADAGAAAARARSTARLSGGERQRLALAGVLALRPGLLLLDEPTAMLDPDGARRLRAVVGERLDASGAGCLLVEHRVALWLDLVDRVVVLAPGAGVIADGPGGSVLTENGPALAGAGVWVPGHLPRPGGAPASRAARGPGPAEPLLCLDGVGVGRRDRPPVLTGVDAVVRAGRAVAVRGPNGAGKSTLALALAGLAAPVAGRLTATRALSDGAGPHPHAWRARQLVARTGSVFQDPRHQFVTRTVAEELAVGPRRAGAGQQEADRTAAELLERLRLGHLARANPFTLSGGEQRRLSVGTALATRPPLLVLDEPTFGQDARTWAELVDLLDEALARGAAVLAATHDDELTAALADEVWQVGEGRVVVRPGAEPRVVRP